MQYMLMDIDQNKPKKLANFTPLWGGEMIRCNVGQKDTG